MRRQSKRIWFVMLGVFTAVFLFTFLAQKFKTDSEVDAASLAGFDPGNIISDYQMSNYNSMSESDIQNFLNSKVSCNKDRGYYDYLKSRYPGFDWHFANGHIICLPEERFGNGEVIGSGETAARIIWKAAQDYRINPQVLIVLLQKEQGLITDNYPNTRQYRSATGYGCPDTAPCSSQYYGFKNQVRKAAAMFRTVLDGGWTNYPLGNNYIQYNPNAACGGSIVNIRSRATSALYRYTPYQPNAGALAAGYGTAPCGAYGNRNFYLYFQDWFGGATKVQRSMKLPNGIYYMKSAAKKNMALDVDAGSIINGANIQLYESNKTDAQKWKFTYNANTDDYSVVNVKSGKSLDVHGAGTENGTNVQQWENNNSCAQRWKIIRGNNDEIALYSVCSGRVLDINAGNIVNRSNVQIWDNNSTNAQKWVLEPAEETPSGLYIVSSSINEAMVLDVSGGSYRAVNGTNLHLWSKNNTAAQRWYIERDSDGYYTIKNKQSNKLVDVEGRQTTNSSNVQLWGGNNTCAQKWRILKNGNEYTVMSACSYKAMDVVAANAKNDANIQIYEANNSKAQKWKLAPISLVDNGEYVVTSDMGGDKVLDIAGNGKYNGANIQIYDFNGTSAQKWTINYDKNTDTYSVYNKGTNKMLDVSAAGIFNNTNVQTWSKNNTCAQKWVISNVGDKNVFYSACSSLVLDVERGSLANGTNVQIYEYNGTKAQKWVLRK